MCTKGKRALINAMKSNLRPSGQALRRSMVEVGGRNWKLGIHQHFTSKSNYCLKTIQLLILIKDKNVNTFVPQAPVWESSVSGTPKDDFVALLYAACIIVRRLLQILLLVALVMLKSLLQPTGTISWLRKTAQCRSKGKHQGVQTLFVFGRTRLLWSQRHRLPCSCGWRPHNAGGITWLAKQIWNVLLFLLKAFKFNAQKPTCLVCFVEHVCYHIRW